MKTNWAKIHAAQRAVKKFGRRLAHLFGVSCVIVFAALVCSWGVAIAFVATSIWLGLTAEPAYQHVVTFLAYAPPIGGLSWILGNWLLSQECSVP